MLSSASCGMPVGYSAILLPQLKAVNGSLQINDDTGSWIGKNWFKSISFLPFVFIVKLYTRH